MDANQLFDTALGMYDFSLVIMIAQHAQKVGLILFLRYHGLSQFILQAWGLLEIVTEKAKRHQRYVTYVLFIILLGPARVSSVPPGTPCVGQILPTVPHRRSFETLRKGPQEPQPRRLDFLVRMR